MKAKKSFLHSVAVVFFVMALVIGTSPNDAIGINLSGDDGIITDAGEIGEAEEIIVPDDEDIPEDAPLDAEGEDAQGPVEEPEAVIEDATEALSPEEPAVAAMSINDPEDAEVEEQSLDGAALELAGITFWGVDGDALAEEDFQVNGTTVTVLTGKHFAMSTPDQTIRSDGYFSGAHNNPVRAKVVIPSGVTANILLAGVGLSFEDALTVQSGAVCHLVIADGTHNSFHTSGSQSAIYNPTGATVTIDDERPNKDSAGNQITPENGVVPRDMTLLDGTFVHKGDRLSVLDSANPGHLLALVTGVGNSAPFGGHAGQAGGTVTINGGNVDIWNAGAPGGSSNCAAALGGGSGGGGTGKSEWITINGGRVDASSYKTGYGHGAAIGGGNAAYTGNIRINGGYTLSTGGSHGSGFGAGCVCPNSSGYQIIITGGTLIPSTVESPYPGCGDIGAPGVSITITGGSVGNGRPGKPFNFVGSAHNASGDSLVMVEVDLRGDVGSNTYPLTKWNLLVGNAPYAYGAPAEFDKGHLYLWLPSSEVANNEIAVNFAYLDPTIPDASGKPSVIEPSTLFRPPGKSGTSADTKLRRYVEFELPQSYTKDMSKYYDGTPFATYDFEAKPITTDENPAKILDDNSCIQFKYQRYDAVGGNPLGIEVTSDSSGNPLSELPADAGIIKFTMTSMQYSQSSNPAYADFKESYWGHRATGWFEIKQIGSTIRDFDIEWVEDGTPGEVEHSADSTLKVSAIIDKAAKDPSGHATAATCKAPRGRVQFYVDDKPASKPIELVFGAKQSRVRSEKSPFMAVARVMAVAAALPNAQEVDNGSGGSYTKFEYEFTPAETDKLLPVATEDNRHTVSLRFVPGLTEDQAAGASTNYASSADPIEEGSEVEQSLVAVGPLDPDPEIKAVSDPSNTDPTAPKPTVETDADPASGNGGLDAAHVYHGSIESSYGVPTEGNPHPGRVTLKIASPSSGDLEVTNADGPFANADFVRDEEGTPLRDENGDYTLIADPVRAGNGVLAFSQKPNGAYTGTDWNYAVDVHADPTIAPEPSIKVTAENLTHPGEPAQPGNKIRYTVTASNAAPGSIWEDVFITGTIPTSMKLVPDSVHLTDPSDGSQHALTPAPAGSEPSPGQYAVTQGSNPTIKALADAVWGGSDAVLTFECVVDGNAAGRGTVTSSSSVATAEGVRPDPANRDTSTLPVDPVTSEPGYPGVTDEVVGANPSLSVDVQVTKPSEGDTVNVGDHVTYDVRLKNEGPASSCLYSAGIVSPLPNGVELVPDTMALTVGNGNPIKVADRAYDAATRTISVQCGDLWGQESVRLSYEAEVTDAANDHDLACVAYVYGGTPSRLTGTPEAEPAAGQPFVLAAGAEPVTQSTPLVLRVAADNDATAESKGTASGDLKKTGDRMSILAWGFLLGAVLFAGLAALTAARSRHGKQRR